MASKRPRNASVADAGGPPIKKERSSVIGDLGVDLGPPAAEPAVCSSVDGEHGSNAPSPAPDIPTIELDSLGDLILVTRMPDMPDQRFRVCSRPLARASPIWKDLLFGPQSAYTRDKAPGKWIVPLGNNPDVLVIPLRGIHGDFDSIPERLSCS